MIAHEKFEIDSYYNLFDFVIAFKILRFCDASFLCILVRKLIWLNCVMPNSDNIQCINSRRRILGGMVLEWFPPQAYCASYWSDMPGVGFAFDAQSGEHSIGSDRKSTFYTHIHSYAYIPDNCDVYSCSEFGGEYLKVSFDGLSDGPVSEFHWPDRPFNNRVSPLVAATFFSIRKHLHCNSPQGDNLLETDLHRLLFHLAQECNAGYRSEERGSALFKNSLYNDLKFWIDSHLAESMSVERMAKQMGLSPAHFARGFKNAFGVSPHRYVIYRRLAKARDMLGTGLPLSVIALECGFNSHSHLSYSFLRYLGVSPTQSSSFY